MIITLELEKHKFDYKFKGENGFGFTVEYDGFLINRVSGKRIYLIAIKNGIRMTEFFKIMKFENGKVTISFGKDKLKLGNYRESE